jgi:hypothetical protein
VGALLERDQLGCVLEGVSAGLDDRRRQRVDHALARDAALRLTTVHRRCRDREGARLAAAVAVLGLGLLLRRLLLLVLLLRGRGRGGRVGAVAV